MYSSKEKLMRLKHLVILMIVAALLLAVVDFHPATQAQVAPGTQQWEYAIMTWKVSTGEFKLALSVLYESDNVPLPIPHDTTRSTWDMVAAIDGAGLVDYLAVLGLNGFELVSVTNIQLEGAFIYIFKRSLGRP